MKPIPLQKSNFRSKLEKRYAELLDLHVKSGVILDARYEAMKLRLADNTHYTPDFFLTFPDRFEFHETKGFKRTSGMLKIKMAAQQYPHFRFVMVEAGKKLGEYIYTDFKAFEEKNGINIRA